jgi:hypothetical protein
MNVASSQNNAFIAFNNETLEFNWSEATTEDAGVYLITVSAEDVDDSICNSLVEFYLEVSMTCDLADEYLIITAPVVPSVFYYDTVTP